MEYSEVYGSGINICKKKYKKMLFLFNKKGGKKNIKKFLKVSCCNSIKLFYLFT